MSIMGLSHERLVFSELHEEVHHYKRGGWPQHAWVGDARSHDRGCPCMRRLLRGTGAAEE